MEEEITPRSDPAACSGWSVAPDGAIRANREEDPGIVVEVLMQNGDLALDIPGQPVPLKLSPPDEEGKWYIRLDPRVAIAFNENLDGKIESFTTYLPDGTTLIRPRIDD